MTLWSRVLLKKLVVPQPGKKFPAFMEPVCSLPCSQNPVICPCCNAVHSLPVLFFYDTFQILSFKLYLDLQGDFPQVSSPKPSIHFSSPLQVPQAPPIS